MRQSSLIGMSGSMPLSTVDVVFIYSWSGLHRYRCKLKRFQHSLPVLRRLRRTPSILTDGRRSKWNPFEASDGGDQLQADHAIPFSTLTSLSTVSCSPFFDTSACPAYCGHVFSLLLVKRLKAITASLTNAMNSSISANAETDAGPL